MRCLYRSCEGRPKLYHARQCGHRAALDSPTAAAARQSRAAAARLRSLIVIWQLFGFALIRGVIRGAPGHDHLA